MFAAWMLTHPGAKLWFMGAEIGQFAEWDEKKQLDWFLLQYDAHARLQHYFAAMNNFYLATPALWDVDPDDPTSAFEWTEQGLWEECILVFRRIAKDGQEVSVVLNFTPVAREDFPIEVPVAGVYRELFNSDELAYGGSGVINTGDLVTSTEGERHTLKLRIPPMGCSILQSTTPHPIRKATTATKRKAPSAKSGARASCDSQRSK